MAPQHPTLISSPAASPSISPIPLPLPTTSPGDEFVSFLVNARVVTPERATRLHPLLHTEPQAVDAVLLKILRLRESFRAIFSLPRRE